MRLKKEDPGGMVDVNKAHRIWQLTLAEFFAVVAIAAVLCAINSVQFPHVVGADPPVATGAYWMGWPCHWVYVKIIPGYSTGAALVDCFFGLAACVAGVFLWRSTFWIIQSLRDSHRRRRTRQDKT